MPGILEAAIVIGGVVNGPIIGLFSVGMLLPWVGARGALTGLLGSVSSTLSLSRQAQIRQKYNKRYPNLR